MGARHQALAECWGPGIRPLIAGMGCTLLRFDRHALQRLRPHLTIGGSRVGPKVVMEVVAHKIPFVEIPADYRSRGVESSVTGSFWKAFKPGLRIIGLVWEYHFGFIRRDRIP